MSKYFLVLFWIVSDYFLLNLKTSNFFFGIFDKRFLRNILCNETWLRDVLSNVLFTLVNNKTLVDLIDFPFLNLMIWCHPSVCDYDGESQVLSVTKSNKKNKGKKKQRKRREYWTFVYNFVLPEVTFCFIMLTGYDSK